MSLPGLVIKPAIATSAGECCSQETRYENINLMTSRLVEINRQKRKCDADNIKEDILSFLQKPKAFH